MNLSNNCTYDQHDKCVGTLPKVKPDQSNWYRVPCECICHKEQK